MARNGERPKARLARLLSAIGAAVDRMGSGGDRGGTVCLRCVHRIGGGKPYEWAAGTWSQEGGWSEGFGAITESSHSRMSLSALGREAAVAMEAVAGADGCAYAAPSLHIPFGGYLRECAYLRKVAWNRRGESRAETPIQFAKVGNLLEAIQASEALDPRIFSLALAGCGLRPGEWTIGIGMTAAGVDVSNARRFHAGFDADGEIGSAAAATRSDMAVAVARGLRSDSRRVREAVAEAARSVRASAEGPSTAGPEAIAMAMRRAEAKWGAAISV